MLPPPRGGEALEAWAVSLSASLLTMLIGSADCQEGYPRGHRSAQAGAENPLGHLGIGLSLGGSDHWADKEPEQTGFATSVLVHLLGVGDQHLVDDRGDGGLVA